MESYEDHTKPQLILFSVLPLTREAANTALRHAGLSGLYAVHRVQMLQSIPVLGTGKTDYQALKGLIV